MQKKVLLTRRKDQATFGGNPVAANQLIGGTIFCDSAEARRGWVRRLNERHPLRFNYFVGFRDVNGEFSLMFGHSIGNSINNQTIH